MYILKDWAKTKNKNKKKDIELFLYATGIVERDSSPINSQFSWKHMQLDLQDTIWTSMHYETGQSLGHENQKDVQPCMEFNTYERNTIQSSQNQHTNTHSKAQ